MQKTPLHLQCQYAYKACTNPRTHKKDGEIHKLCAVHRDRANSVQKIYAAKRRARAREERKQKIIQNKAAASTTTPSTLDRQTSATKEEPTQQTSALGDTLDAWTLEVLMSNPIIEPIMSPTPRDHSFSTEEYDILCNLLLKDELYL
ncbi:hypothetical protein LEN26_013048 [Aphanomyces euteiches]|nr:hypothetical protein AeMF1_019394 [Aphanomyces euteiches]KAH9114310.1 hypothetical protein LEN26_013048 [Aphanomyces euteiches]KAH9187947.1 hypothetical protein AeNC1_010074 [Aphanomyces euteiches]